MSKRSVETLQNKLRAIELQHDQDLLGWLEDLEAVARRDIASGHNLHEVLQSVLFSGIDGAVELASQALDRFTEENAFAIGRDMKAVGANSGREEEVRLGLEDFDPFGWTQGAKETMERWRETAKVQYLSELNRQRRMAATHDDDPDLGLIDRVLSMERVLRPGRPGQGLLWSISVAHSTVFITVGWQMINEQRLDAIRAISG